MDVQAARAQLDKLTAHLKQLADGRRICIAFSGGVDSALLVKAACDADLDVCAVTFRSTLQPQGETEQAAKQAAAYGARHVILDIDPLSVPEVKSNSRERCYHCKRALFRALDEFSLKEGYASVADGTNADDLNQYRPGLKALRELGISSPLADLGFTKGDVRAMAEAIGLDVAARPSSPCLATRFPYGTDLTPEALARVGRAENALHALGLPIVRVRVLDTAARIEVPYDAMGTLAAAAREAGRALRAEGFSYVMMDLAGYRSGSFDAPAEPAKA